VLLAAGSYGPWSSWEPQCVHELQGTYVMVLPVSTMTSKLLAGVPSATVA